MATLFEMTQQAHDLYELLQGEIIDEQTFKDTLEAIGTEEKIEGYCQVIKNLQADLDMFKAEADRIAERMKPIKNNIDRMKESLLTFLKVSGQEKVKAGTFSVAVSRTEQTKVIDETLIPAQYKTPQPDKISLTAIKSAIKNGEVVNGAEIVINEGVRIR